jgi:hypothetical protein
VAHEDAPATAKQKRDAVMQCLFRVSQYFRDMGMSGTMVVGLNNADMDIIQASGLSTENKEIRVVRMNRFVQSKGGGIIERPDAPRIRLAR